MVSPSELLSRRGEWKRNGVAVVCVAGRFDLLHPGHVRLLEQARALGDILLVAVSDEVAPGPARRAITPASERVEILAALATVDYATELTGGPVEFLRALAPDVIAEGGTGHPRAKELSSPGHPRGTNAEASGSKVVRIPLEPGYSTSTIVERILQTPA